MTEHKVGDTVCIQESGELLSPVHAVIAMAKGETLYNEYGLECVFNKHEGKFELLAGDGTRLWFCTLDEFTTLYRLPQKRRRSMTPEEVRAWAESDESLGWMVRICDGRYLSIPRKWSFPRFYNYEGVVEYYQRARMLPDMSGIDESTIQGFEVEE
jgi:hypothetical protein